jgi:aldehyde dehydrogenase (NAD+)
MSEAAAKVIPIDSANIAKIIAAQRAFFRTGATRSLEYRSEQIKKLGSALEKHEQDITRALTTDLGKCETEGFLTEIATTLEEVRHTLKHMRKWAKSRVYPTNIILQPAKSEVRPEPKGVVLIIGPWNYPFNLIGAPLVASIAAGNCNVVKPSELAPATSAIIAKIVRENFDPAFLACVEGGIEASTALLDQQFDHIFFTGGTGVGRVVMEKAAKFLTPVTLELGGKSPTIVTKNANLDHAARRITWGKFVNAGQTCIAPDYLLVERGVAAEFVDTLKARITANYGANPKDSPDFARIINTRHLKRIASYMKDGTIAFGGEVVEAEKYIAPTLITQPKMDAPIMQDEIFGPVLPIIEYDTADEALAITQARDRPLAMYVFSDNASEAEYFLSRQISGDACVNEAVMHFANPNLPFGGVGGSGMGAYHGIRGFEEFSHMRSVLTRYMHFENPLMALPYKDKLGTIKKLLRLMHLVL